MALLNKYLSNCSPYILQFSYDLDEREIVIDFAKDTKDWLPGKRLIFSDILEFSQELLEDAYEDTLIDSIMGFHLLDEGIYCVTTEKRELVLRVGADPISQIIT